MTLIQFKQIADREKNLHLLIDTDLNKHNNLSGVLIIYRFREPMR